MPTTNNPSPQHENEHEQDDYINMELSSRNSSSSSSPQTKDFEFQTLSLTPTTKQTNHTAFPADDLFYKGKLLPLLLPSRRQMLRDLTVDDFTKMPFPQTHNYHSLPSTHTLNTPSHSRNISPSESRRVSCELNPDDYFFEWSTGLSCFVNNNNHKKKKLLPWPKKLKLGNKLKSSRAYLKSLFTSNNNCGSGRNYEEIADEYKKNATTIGAIMKGADYKDGTEYNGQRRSFSSAIKWGYQVKCLSSSSSSSSSSSGGGFNELRRSSSVTEIEGSIEAAIAHCKKSNGVDAEGKRSGFCSI